MNILQTLQTMLAVQNTATVPANVVGAAGGSAVLGLAAALGMLGLGATGIVLYLLRAIGLYRLGKAQQLPHLFLCWIPVANRYLMGNLADDCNQRAHRFTRWRVWLPTLCCMQLTVQIFIGIRIWPQYQALMQTALDGGSYTDAINDFTKSLAGSNFLSVMNMLVQYAYLAVGFFALLTIYRFWAPDKANLYFLITVLVSTFVLDISGLYLFYLGNRANRMQNHWQPPFGTTGFGNQNGGGFGSNDQSNPNDPGQGGWPPVR